MSAHILETTFLPFLLLRWVQQVTKLAGWLAFFLAYEYFYARTTNLRCLHRLFIHYNFWLLIATSLCVSVCQPNVAHRCFFPIATHFDTFLLLSEGNEILIYSPMCRSRCKTLTTKPLLKTSFEVMVWAIGGARKRTIVIEVWCYAWMFYAWSLDAYIDLKFKNDNVLTFKSKLDRSLDELFKSTVIDWFKSDIWNA